MLLRTSCCCSVWQWWCLPLYVALAASTMTLDQTLESPMSLVPGTAMWSNYVHVLTHGSNQGASAPVGPDAVQQFRDGDGDRSRQNQHFDHLGICDRVLQVSAAPAVSSG